ncbi:protein YIPF4 isoform X2 [Hydra vulgaris]|uniref:Protein YIPF n=1 Tax=Hydra vulgaris TaxID=6087 RepID=A0ABM4CJK7_HYDVU
MDPPRDFMTSSLHTNSSKNNEYEGQFTFESFPDTDGVSGMMSGKAEKDVITTHTSLFDNNLTNSLLNKKGISWLLEVEDDDDETFDKPLLEELDIDLKDIFYKVRCILFPLPQLGFERKVLKENPDFWGPLIIVLCYSLLSLYGQFKVVSWIITIWFCGSFVIFFLTRALGGEVSFSQCLGVIGYSLLPLIVTGLALPFLHQLPTIFPIFFKVAGIVWSSYSAGSLLVPETLYTKRLLLLYPIFLLYVYFFSLYTGA